MLSRLAERMLAGIAADDSALIKAAADKAHLVRKIIVNKKGKRQTVWVLPLETVKPDRNLKLYKGKLRLGDEFKSDSFAPGQTAFARVVETPPGSGPVMAEVHVKGHDPITVPIGKNGKNGFVLHKMFTPHPKEYKSTERPLNYLNGKLIPRKGPWINAVPGMPKFSIEPYLKDGVLAPERKALHDKIVDSFFEDVTPVPVGKTPVAIMMMGGPASGKSSMVRASGAAEDNFMVVDVDAIKEQIPEYQRAVSNRAKNAAAMVHDESSDWIGKRVRDRAIEERYNVVIDGTGKTLTSYVTNMAKLKEQGYRVTLMLADSTAEIGQERQKPRARRTGRYVPSFVFSAYKTIPANFAEFRSEADQFFVYDTRTLPAKLVWSSSADGQTETVHDTEWMADFISRSNMGMQKADKPPKRLSAAQIRDSEDQANRMVNRLVQNMEEAEAELEQAPEIFSGTEGIVQQLNEPPE